MLAAFESPVDEETVALFESMVAGDAITVTVTVTVAFPDAASAPRLVLTSSARSRSVQIAHR